MLGGGRGGGPSGVLGKGRGGGPSGGLGGGLGGGPSGGGLGGGPSGGGLGAPPMELEVGESGGSGGRLKPAYWSSMSKTQQRNWHKRHGEEREA